LLQRCIWIVAVACLAAAAQTPQPQPPPVILLNGYQLICPANPVPSSDTFGRLEALLTESGRKVYFFDNCRHGRVSIAQLSQAFKTFLGELRNEDGTPVAQVDLIAHSMGGLIIRCYLAGCDAEDPIAFHPPFPKRVRKAVTIGTPHFGAEFGGTAAAPDLQAASMVPGSAFLYNLATWNQFRDDWRGVDVVAIVGRSLGTRLGDGLVSAVSASSYFAFGIPEDRTRVVSGCHTGGFAALFLGCSLTEPTIANVTGSNHATWRLVDAFLNKPDSPLPLDLSSAAEDNELGSQAGLWLTYRTAHDATSADTLTATWNGTESLSQLPGSPVLFLPRTPQVADAPLEISLEPGAPRTLTLGRGTRTLLWKQGVEVTGVEAVSTADGIYAGAGRALAGDGGSIRILGNAALATATEVLLDGTLLETWSAEASGALVAQVPARAEPGVAILRIRTAAAGEHSIRLLFGHRPAKLDRERSTWPNFYWAPVEGASGYVLWVGSEAGKSDIYDSGFTVESSRTIEAAKPESPLYVRLWTLIDGDWYFVDYL
jgi:pimeloyl-ACP methyl ester carboxylesterase